MSILKTLLQDIPLPKMVRIRQKIRRHPIGRSGRGPSHGAEQTRRDGPDPAGTTGGGRCRQPGSGTYCRLHTRNGRSDSSGRGASVHRAMHGQSWRRNGGRASGCPAPSRRDGRSDGRADPLFDGSDRDRPAAERPSGLCRQVCIGSGRDRRHQSGETAHGFPRPDRKRHYENDLDRAREAKKALKPATSSGLNIWPRTCRRWRGL